MASMLIDAAAVIYVLSAILIFVMIFLERAEPRTVVFWSVVLLGIPIVGFFIYLCFGQTFYTKRQFSVKNLNDEQIAQIQDEGLSMINALHSTPELEGYRPIATALSKASGSIYTNNNKVDLFTEGDDFFERLFQDIRNAKTFIHIEFYILRSDELGNEFMDLLIEKAREGVEVRLMIDAFGIKSSLESKVLELIRSGGEYTLFHKAVTVLLSPRKNNRNHRKLAVIDGTIGYVAGFNIGDEYLGKGEFGYWRDSGVRVEGHGVIPINLRFFMDWSYASEKKLAAEEKYFPLDNDDIYGDDIFQLISGGPDSKMNPVELQYLEIINAARDTLYIHTPYLVPDKSTMQALQLAAYSGVDVKIIIPNRPDHPFVYWATLWYAGELMEKGVRIFMYDRGFVHSKTMVADGVLCSVGSANLDQRSMNLNFETNAMIYSTSIGEKMNNAFLEDLAYCSEYSLEEHNGMSVGRKFKMIMFRLFSSLA